MSEQMLVNKGRTGVSNDGAGCWLNALLGLKPNYGQIHTLLKSGAI